MSKKKPVRLSREEKLAWVEQILLKKKTVPEVAKITGVNESTVYEWRKKYQENPGEFMPGSGNLKESDRKIKDLEKQLKDARDELEFLKKATAYFIKNPV